MLRMLKESSNRRFYSYSVRNSVLIISNITFRDCRVYIFSDISKQLYMEYFTKSARVQYLRNHFRPRPPPTTRVEFLESEKKKGTRKRDSQDHWSMAMQWSFELFSENLHSFEENCNLRNVLLYFRFQQQQQPPYEGGLLVA